ncbi:MAG: hypothetical protein AAGM22_25705 [Acidobacteriota bacterium]
MPLNETLTVDIPPLDSPIIQLGVEFEHGEVRFVEIDNSNPGVFEFNAKETTLTVAPWGENFGYPFLYQVIFVALGFRFRGGAVGPVQWESPRRQPKYVKTVELNTEQNAVVFIIALPDERRSSAQFLLISDSAQAPEVRIDPTIVNNPDPPPDMT